jgi:hypothetical protein
VPAKLIDATVLEGRMEMVLCFMICTIIIYFYCTQLVSTIMSVTTYPMLGVDHAISAVPKAQLGDGCARGRGRLE